MKLLVLGATGGTGLEIISQAIERGHSLTAFVRAPDPLKRFGDRIAVIRGDLLNSSEVQRVLKGHDAVLSGFGPRLPVCRADATLLQRFAVALTSGMDQAGVRRVVVESTAFLFKDSIIPPTNLFGRLFFPDVVRDAGEMENVFRKSGLDWTMVRPPRLTDQPRTGKYRVLEGPLPRFGFAISRADVADFMIKAGENGVSIGKVVGVSN
ncbi:MAG TPA: SDR family oxidoreductase [Chthoniobacterales bacterium]|nr:SDR family oxidoreductase [Chthoniobacterales bacterium]